MADNIIYKYGPIGFDGTNIKGQVVHVGLQNDEIFVWTHQELAINIHYLYRTVKLYPTGVQFAGEYLGTVVMPSGLVWHVVEAV